MWKVIFIKFMQRRLVLQHILICRLNHKSTENFTISRKKVMVCINIVVLDQCCSVKNIVMCLLIFCMNSTIIL